MNPFDARSDPERHAMWHLAEPRNLLLQRRAFAPKNEMLGRKNAFDSLVNLAADCSVLSRQIKLRNRRVCRSLR